MRTAILLSVLSIGAFALPKTDGTAEAERFSRIEVTPADDAQGKNGGGGARPPAAAVPAPRPQSTPRPSSPTFNSAPRLQNPPSAPRPSQPSVPRPPSSNQGPPRIPSNPSPPRPVQERPPPRPVEGPRGGTGGIGYSPPPPRPVEGPRGGIGNGPPPPRPVEGPRGGIGNGPLPPRPPSDRPRGGPDPRLGGRPAIPVGERPPNWTRPPPPPNGVRPGAYPPPPPPGTGRERGWDECRRGLCGGTSNRGRDWGPVDCRRGGCEGWTNYRGEVFRGGYWRDGRGYIWREDAWYDLVGRRYPGPTPIILIEPVPVGVPAIPNPFRPRPAWQSIDDYCYSLDVDTRDLPDVCLDACEQTRGGYDFCWVGYLSK